MSALGSFVAVVALLAIEPAAPPSALADDIEWSAPPSCPDRQALLDGILRRRGVGREPGQVRVVARTTAEGPRRYRMALTLDLGGRHENGVLHASTCTALIDAAALRIAVALAATSPAAIEPRPAATDLPLEPAEPAEPTEPTMPVSADPEPPAATPLDPIPEAAPLDETLDLPPIEPVDGRFTSTPTERRRRALGGFVRLHGIGEVGALPGVSGGVGLAGGLLWRRARLEIEADYVAPRGVARPQAEVRASLIAGAVHGCARLGRGRLEVPLCGGVEVGAMPGSADGPGVGGAAVGRWLAGVVTVALRWRITGNVALWGAVRGLAAVQRTTFVLRDPGPEVLLFDPGVLSGRLALGVELRFGDPRP